MEEHETGLELKRVRNPLFFRNKHDEHQHDFIQQYFDTLYKECECAHILCVCHY